jgi:hypothetical protein
MMGIPTADQFFSGLDLRDEIGTVKVLVAGDLYPGGPVEKNILDWPSTKIWQDILKETVSHDLSVVNLESPLTYSRTPISKGGPHLWADPLCAKGIRGAQFDVVTIANNHIMDMGKVGLTDTMDACKDAGLMVVGAGENLDEATRPLYVDINGLRIAILSVTEHEFSIATDESAGAWPLDPLDNYYQIQAARQKSDFVLIILHGGNEYYPLPSPNMVKTCRFLVDAGANAVVCHHTHVPSGVEIYHDAPIVCSTGNFLFYSGGTIFPEWFSGYLVSISIRAGAVTSFHLVPYWQSRGALDIRFMNENEAHTFLADICRFSGIIRDKESLTREWTRFCAAKRNDYLSRMLLLNRVEHKLLKMNMGPFWRTSTKCILELLSLFDCESHRDVCVGVLRSEIRKRRKQ